MTVHPRNVVPDRRDQEFLPAALEILETPPAPLQSVFLLSICSFVALALFWAYFSRIDIIATAQGKVQPTGRVKLVQPSETGRVTLLNARNGQHVAAGDTLIELDAAEARAEEAAIAAEYAGAVAEVERRKAAMDVARVRGAIEVPRIVWPKAIPAAVRQREDRVLVADLGQLAASVASLGSQIKQKEAERDRLLATISSENQLIATLNERVQMRDTLAQQKVGSRASLIDAMETLQTQKTTLVTQTGQERESEANIAVLKDEIIKTFGNFLADNGQRLDDAERRVDDAEQRLIKAHARTMKMTLKSPIDGTLQASSVTTVGQVVTVGEELMRIVPDGSGLEIECYMPNKDVGFVKAGQPAVVKLEAFPFTRYGTLDAKVMQVAGDAIPEPDAQQIEANPARSNKSMFSGAERTQNLVFAITLSPAKSKMDVDGLAIPLSPGMAASVEIRTGSRRILEYLFSPVVEVASKAMRER